MVAVVQKKPQVQKAVERIVAQIAQQSGQPLAIERMRIQIGRRIQYGELANGNRRDDLTNDATAAILSAIKEPVTQGIDPEDYEGSRPNIRISVGDPQNGYETLFSQERDGNISINRCQVEQQAQANSSPIAPESQGEAAYKLDGNGRSETSVVADALEAYAAPAIATESKPPDDLAGDHLITTTVQAEDLLDLLPEVVNPLKQKMSKPIEAGLGDYTIQLDGKDATVLKGDEVLFKTTNGQVTQSRLSQKDTQALQSLLQNSSPFAESWSVPIQTVDPTLITSETSPAIAVAQQQIAALPEGQSKRFFEKLGADLDQQVERATQAVQRGLKSEPFQNARAVAQTMPEKMTVLAGRSMEKAGQWLASRPEKIREQRAARATLTMVMEGIDRTHETSFKQGGFVVGIDEKTKQFSLSNAETGETLLRFKAEKSPIPGMPKLTITEKGDISPMQYQAFDAVARSGEVVRGSPEAETRHAALSKGFADFCRTFAKAQESHDCKTKHYRIETDGDGLKISSLKNGRELYRQDGEQISSRLGQKDFEKFGLAQTLVERSAAPLKSAVNSPQTTSAELG